MASGVVEQRLSHAGGFELLRQISVEFVARKSLQVIFDRMLVCQAIVHGLAILTPDEWIARYPVRVVW